MTDDDILEIGGVSLNRKNTAEASGLVKPKRFLSIWYRCCHTYGRMVRNKEQTAYEGRCPKCGVKVHAAIGTSGTNRRMFEAQ